MKPLVLRDVEVDSTRVDVTVLDGAIAAVGPGGDPPAHAEVLDGHGGALLPGLWDHHIHLVALAAARRSVPAGPPDVTDADQLATALRAAAGTDPGVWRRAVGYHESVAGELDRDLLDGLAPDGPVRVQHRSGAMWVLNTAAIDLLGLEAAHHRGLERDAGGRLTGRLYGADQWLRDRLQTSGATGPPPDLAVVGAELAGYGVTGVTDATPSDGLEDLDLLATAAAGGALPQRVVAMGGPPLTTAPFPDPLRRGPVKLLVADHALPPLDDLVRWITAARQADRPVAAHCVTRTSLVLVLTALDIAGHDPGDRIEHGSVIPPELRGPLSTAGCTVVTQPNFVAERGDQYLADVDVDDRPHLYPCRSLLDAGVAVAGSTDAPFGHPDPWRAVAAAVERRTPTGAELGAEERVPADRAIELFLGGPDDPGRSRRRVVPGAAADLCLLDAPWRDVCREPSAERVRATIIGGRLVG